MSRQAVWRVLAVYLGIAALYGAFHVLATTGSADWRWAVIIGSAIGSGIGLLLLTGILPLLFWAFGRFRAEKAGVPLVIWGFLWLLFALAATGEDFYEGNLALKNIPANVSAFFSSDYDTFIRTVKASCIESRNRNSTERQGGLSDQEFAAFCQCYSEALLKELTVQEFRVAMDARVTVNPPPAWMREKTGRAAIACESFAVSH